MKVLSLLSPPASFVPHRGAGIHNSLCPPILAAPCDLNLSCCFSSLSLILDTHQIPSLGLPDVVAYLFPFKHFKKVPVQIIFSNLHHIPERPLVMLC